MDAPEALHVPAVTARQETLVIFNTSDTNQNLPWMYSYQIRSSVHVVQRNRYARG